MTGPGKNHHGQHPTLGGYRTRLCLYSHIPKIIFFETPSRSSPIPSVVLVIFLLDPTSRQNCLRGRLVCSFSTLRPYRKTVTGVTGKPCLLDQGIWRRYWSTTHVKRDPYPILELEKSTPVKDLSWLSTSVTHVDRPTSHYTRVNTEGPSTVVENDQ